MPEIIRRRGTSRGTRLFQVLIAVLAGMASMYCLQNLVAAQKFSAAPSKPAVKSSPLQPERPLTPPQAPPRTQIGRTQSHMMVKSEAGGAKMGVQAVFGEQAPPEARKALSTARWREVKLQSRPMNSKYGSQGVTSEGSGFKPIEHTVLAAPKRDVIDKENDGARRLAAVEKSAKPSENLVASMLDPEVILEKPFWTPVRQARVGGSALIAVAGFFYLLSADGVFAQRKPEIAEGEM